MTLLEPGKPHWAKDKVREEATEPVEAVTDDMFDLRTDKTKDNIGKRSNPNTGCKVGIIAWLERF